MRNYGQCIDRHPEASQEFDEFGGQIVTPRVMNTFDEMSDIEVEEWAAVGSSEEGVKFE
jgi:hypothetical protein